MSPEEKRDQQWKSVIANVEAKLEEDNNSSRRISSSHTTNKPSRAPPPAPSVCSKPLNEPPLVFSHKLPKTQQQKQQTSSSTPMSMPTSSLLELKQEMEAQMMGTKEHRTKEKGIGVDVFSRQGRVKTTTSSQQHVKKFGTSSRRAFASLSNTTNPIVPAAETKKMEKKETTITKEVKSRMDMLEDFRSKKKKTSSTITTRRKPLSKKLGGASRRVVHAGGITKKDKYSDIHRARQQMVAAHLANKENR